MSNLDPVGDFSITCEPLGDDVCRTFDKLLQSVRCTVSGESSDTLVATAKTVAFTAIASYWDALLMSRRQPGALALRNLSPGETIMELAAWADELATAAGAGCVALDTADAGYRIGSLYTSLMPEEIRSRLGAYYTPPALCERLLDMVTAAGVDWGTARVLDPACGGGAFLSPVAKRMMEGFQEKGPENCLASVERRLRGVELDPFAAWMSQVLLDATLIDTCLEAGRLPERVVTVCDALGAEPENCGFDLVIGNPPYGRIRLSQDLRRKFSRSLYGHANLYGIFTDLALRFARPNGVVGYVTPTSFLAGAYFKALRGLLGTEASLAGIDFMTERSGVFEDVLQETALTVYRMGDSQRPGEVRFTSVCPDGSVESIPGWFFPYPCTAGATLADAAPPRARPAGAFGTSHAVSACGLRLQGQHRPPSLEPPQGTTPVPPHDRVPASCLGGVNPWRGIPVQGREPQPPKVLQAQGGSRVAGH